MTDTSNSASAQIDLNQLKIKSSALKTSYPIIFSVLCLIGIGGGGLVQFLSQQKDKPLNASRRQYSKKWQQTTKNQLNSHTDKRREKIKPESKSEPIDKQETKENFESLKSIEQEKKPTKSNFADQSVARNQKNTSNSVAQPVVEPVVTRNQKNTSNPVAQPVIASKKTISSVDLHPITNKICSQNEILCIYNLADLIRKNKSQAFYNLTRTSRKAGQINARGTITNYGSDAQANNNSFTFKWKDDVQSTTNGYGAEGLFILKKGAGGNNQGVLINFKITNKFGNKKSRWREKSVYLFPR